MLLSLSAPHRLFRGHAYLVLICVLLLGGCSIFSKDKRDDLAELEGPPSFILVVNSSDKNLRALLQQHLDLRRYSHLSDLSDGEMHNLMQLATQDASEILSTQGYINPIIQVTRSEALPGEKLPTITVDVQAGPPTTVTELKLQFSGPISTAKALPETIQRRTIRQFWQLPKGQRFTQSGWNAAKGRAERDLTAERYLAGKISSSAARLDADNNTAQLALNLDSGPVYHFGASTISGLKNYQPEMVQRFLRIPEGDQYSLVRLLQAQQRLVDTGFFDSVFLYMDPADDPSSTTVQVQLNEAKLQKIVLGVGASTDSGAGVSVEHTHNISPFFGWKSVTKASLNQREHNLQAELISQPSADYWRWVLAANALRERDDEQDTRSQTLRAGRIQTNEKIDRSIYAELTRSSLLKQDPNTLALFTDRNSALSVNWAWTMRNYDSKTFPTSGWGLGVELGGGLTLSTQQSQRRPFTRGVVRWQSYHPLDEFFEFDTDTDQGRIALRGQAAGISSKKDASLPAKLLFITGGDGSVRGYPYRSISAGTQTINNRNYPLPGRFLLVGSAEWQRPIYRQGVRSDWETAVFIDTGAVADEPKDMKLKTGVGAGLRWRSPIGPFQADLAYGLKARKMRLHLNVGFVF